MPIACHTAGNFFSQSNMGITGGMTAQATQGHAVDESIAVDEESESISVKTVSIEAYTEEEIIILSGQLVEAKHWNVPVAKTILRV